MARISVIMPVCDAEAYVDAAITSVIQQSYRDFTLLIVNDGSTDNSAVKLEQWQQRDPRVKVIHQSNQGISASLNTLIDSSDSEFIMRMDADDVSDPRRMATQLAALQADSECGMVGSKVRLIGAQSGVWHYRQTDQQTKALALLGNTCLCHPSWMMRREALGDLRYSTEYPHMEDMFLLAQYITQPHSKLYALDQVLLDYRIHPQSVSNVNCAQQLEQRTRILAWLWSEHGLQYRDTDPQAFIAWCYSSQTMMEPVDNDLKSDLIARIFPQLIKHNPGTETELDRRLKAS